MPEVRYLQITAEFLPIRQRKNTVFPVATERLVYDTPHPRAHVRQLIKGLQCKVKFWGGDAPLATSLTCASTK